MDAGATQVGIFSKQVWVLSGERHQQRLHGGSTSDHADDVNAMRTAVKALRQTVT